MTSPFLHIATGLLRGRQLRQQEDAEAERYEQQRADRIAQQQQAAQIAADERKYQRERDAAAEARQAALDAERTQDRLRAGFEGGYIPQTQLRDEGRQVEQIASQSGILPDFTGVTTALRGVGQMAQQAKPVYSVGGTALAKGRFSLDEQARLAAQQARDADQREARGFREQDQQFQAAENEKNRQNQVRLTGMQLAAQSLRGSQPTARQQMTSEGERKAAGFALRMEDSAARMGRFEPTDPGKSATPAAAKAATDSVNALVPSIAQRARGRVPFVGDQWQRSSYSPEQQEYWAAARDWLASVLRKESGAQINAQEWAEGQDRYFPVPGDSPAALAQKQRNRKTAEAAVMLEAGRAGPSVGPATPASGPRSPGDLVRR